MRTRFILGEDKYVKIRVSDPMGQPFEIFSATYELKRYGEIVQSGSAFIDGDNNHDISARIRPEQPGQHVLEFTYQVSDTVRKARIDVEVV